MKTLLAYVSAFVISRHHLALEAVVLRQQLTVYKRKQPHPKLRSIRLDVLGCRSADALRDVAEAGRVEDWVRRENRHVVGDERALQERSSESILTSSLAQTVVKR